MHEKYEQGGKQGCARLGCWGIWGWRKRSTEEGLRQMYTL